MVKGIDDLRVVDLKDELKSRGIQFESKMRKAHLKQLLETTMSESGLDSSLYDFEANKTISETPQKAATPTKRNDTPAVMTPRRSRRISGQSSDGEASDAESKPVRRKLLKNLESVQEEPEETLPETPISSTPIVRRSRRLSNQSVENDQEQEAQKLPSLPEAIIEEEEGTEEKEKLDETIRSNASSPIIKVNLKPAAIIIDSEEEAEQADAENSEETAEPESPAGNVEKEDTEEKKKDTIEDQELEEESQFKEDESEEKHDSKSTEVSAENVKDAQESDEKNEAMESEGEDAENIADSFTKSEDDEMAVPEDEGIHISEELNPAIFEALEKSENTRKRKIKWAKKRPAKKKLTAFPDDRGIHAMPSSFVDKIDSRCQSAVDFRNRMMGRHDQARMSKEKSLIQMMERGQSKKSFKNSLKEKNRKIFQKEKFERIKKERNEKKIQSAAKIAAKN